MNNLTRRSILIAIGHLSVASALLSCDSGGSPQLSNSSADEPLALLASISFDLFPYEALPPELYVKVAEQLLALENPIVAAGLVQLQDLAGGGSAWVEMPEPDRVSALSSLEKSDFFALVRTTSIEVIYREPEMIELIGYGGSAIDKGGYLNRGFDDISWLPTSTSASTPMPKGEE